MEVAKLEQVSLNFPCCTFADISQAFVKSLQ